MISRIVQGNQLPEEWIIGQTYICCNLDIKEITPEEESECDPYTLYEYTEITMTPAEYSAVINGRYTGEYTESFRRKEREVLLTKADQMKEKANDYITANIDKTKWQQYLKDVVEYKIAVRDTVNQPNFPASVSYPPLPSSPSQ